MIRRSRGALARPGIRFRRLNTASWIALGVMTALGLVAVFCSVVATHDPDALSVHSGGPSAAHWFGTDQSGRDIFSRLVYGTRWSLAIGLGALAVVSITQIASASHVRPKGATPMLVSLVPAYKVCTAPNRTHGTPLAFPSCNPPVQASNFLTVGTPDANGAGAHSVDVTSGKGQVVLDLPRDLDATLELETAYTDNLGHKTSIVSDWPLQSTETDNWDRSEGTPRRYVRARQTIGRGGSTIRVRTVNGNVVVHRDR